jgi:outer membrane protein assembly factor BamC
MLKLRFRLLAVTLIFTGLGACSSYNVDDVLPDKSVEYKRERQAEKNLELPPDLTSDRINDRMSVPDSFGGVSTSYSEFVTDRQVRGVDQGPRSASASSVLPEISNIEVRRDGDARWLRIRSPAEDVWESVVDYWQENGILMVEQDPTTGIMRTSWIENRAEISRDIVTNTIRRAFDGLYETGKRDQFRIRLERTEDDGTELFLTHFGMQEEVTAVAQGGVESTVWVPRERDPGLEAEMLRRLMVYLGSADEKARTALAAKGVKQKESSRLLNTQDGVRLLIDDSFGRSWRLVGLALDRVGFAVEDRDRSAGTYYVRYNDPSVQDADKGWLSSLKFWGDEEVDKVNRYQVKVSAGDGNTVVKVANEQGQDDGSATAVRILTLLQEQIR